MMTPTLSIVALTLVGVALVMMWAIRGDGSAAASCRKVRDAESPHDGPGCARALPNCLAPSEPAEPCHASSLRSGEAGQADGLAY
jgi:hypothetical protein